MEVFWLILLTVACVLCSGGALIKSFSWYDSMRWAGKNGVVYSNFILAKPDISKECRFALIRCLGGGRHWPGVKSVRLLGFKSNSIKRVLVVPLVYTPIFLILCSVVALTASFAHPAFPVRVIAEAISLWLGVYSLALMLEAVFWYLISRNYALVWGGLKFRSSISATHLSVIGDVKGFGSVTLVATLASSIMTCVTVQTFGGFVGIGPSSASELGISTLVSSTYYVLATMTTVGDDSISPVTTLARIDAGLVHLSVLLILTLAISTLGSRLQGIGSRK